MNFRKLISIVCIMVASGALILAYGLRSDWVGSAAALGLGFWGLYGFYNLQDIWIIDLFFGGAVILVVIGGLIELAIYLLFIALVGALGAWDLVRFGNRMGRAPDQEDIKNIEKRHFILLGLAVVGGMLLAGIMLTARMQISFYATLILGVILIISLGQVVRLIRN